MRYFLRMNHQTKQEVIDWASKGLPVGISPRLAQFIYWSLRNPMPGLPDDLEAPVCQSCLRALEHRELPTCNIPIPGEGE
jgi:hypothetical protein